MFDTLLIANRGEIALRVLRTAHRLGLRTVAVYSTADADAPHVRLADRAVCIGAPAPADSYLNIPALLEAARRTGAQAVHPGYGFLAENAAFAQACRDAGLVFVGPSPEAIRAMGDKAGAKARMREAGVPCIPGWQGEDQSAERLLREAQAIGWPVMVKATAGGGGRGMRLVRSAAEFPEALRSAQSEARHAFGDATVLLERGVERPRHVEIQVLADRHGRVLHLGERDCSVQRRHQKIVEEAPSPAVDAALRGRMGAAAVAAARAIGYEGAGTLEFLLDGDGRFFFMEMNTRLQVEHPVTEALTGLDLVEWQLRVAMGEALPWAQEEIRFEGHAIEVRLCAEDPARQFLPQAGRVLRWRVPADLRVEHALHDSAAVPPHYDSMVAKLVAHGRDRADARRRLARGLRTLVALGLPTNQALLQAVLAHPVFARGEATTAFVGEHLPELLATDAAASTRAAAVAAWLLVTPASAPAALLPGLPVTLPLEVDGQLLPVRVLQRSEDCTVEAGGSTHTVVAAPPGDGEARITLDGVGETLSFARDGDTLWIHLDGRAHRVQDHTRVPAARPGAAGGDGCVRASGEGRVAAVLVAAGDAVQAGQPLLVTEAMKMEHFHAAPVAGIIRAMHAVPGVQVTAGMVLAEIEPAAS
jgi:geranyl-CoA carboxylase alpha subunit